MYRCNILQITYLIRTSSVLVQTQTHCLHCFMCSTLLLPTETRRRTQGKRDEGLGNLLKEAVEETLLDEFFTTKVTMKTVTNSMRKLGMSWRKKVHYLDVESGDYVPQPLVDVSNVQSQLKIFLGRTVELNVRAVFRTSMVEPLSK